MVRDRTVISSLSELLFHPAGRRILFTSVKILRWTLALDEPLLIDALSTSLLNWVGAYPEGGAHGQPDLAMGCNLGSGEEQGP
jgi:hypothetical protein